MFPVDTLKVSLIRMTSQVHALTVCRRASKLLTLRPGQFTPVFQMPSLPFQE